MLSEESYVLTPSQLFFCGAGSSVWFKTRVLRKRIILSQQQNKTVLKKTIFIIFSLLHISSRSKTYWTWGRGQGRGGAPARSLELESLGGSHSFQHLKPVPLSNPHARDTMTPVISRLSVAFLSFLFIDQFRWDEVNAAVGGVLSACAKFESGSRG